MKRLLALLPVLPLLTGCPSFTTMGTARTLDQGRSQFFVATGGLVAQSFQTDPGTGKKESFGLPSFEFGGRYAVTDNAEVGGKVWLLGAELNSKFALARTAQPGAGLNVALAPALSFYNFSASDSTTATYAWVHLPLLFGIGTTGGSELTIGPRVSDMIVSSGGDTLNAIWLGGSLGYAWKVGPGFRILPEVTFTYPVHTSVGGSSVTEFDPKGAIIQANIGFLLGGD
jgi:hypothetical protein